MTALKNNWRNLIPFKWVLLYKLYSFKEYYLLEYNSVQSNESQPMFLRNISPPFSGSKNKPNIRNQRESRWQAEQSVCRISDYLGKRREMEEQNSVPVGLPIVEYETSSIH
jgi:hypothetical protein